MSGRGLGIVVSPDANYQPSTGYQTGIGIGVSSSIRLDLLPPPLGVGLRPRSVLRAAVPETAVHENRHARGGEHKIPTAAETRERRVHTETKPESVDGRAQRQLARRVPSEGDL